MFRNWSDLIQNQQQNQKNQIKSQQSGKAQILKQQQQDKKLCEQKVEIFSQQSAYKFLANSINSNSQLINGTQIKSGQENQVQFATLEPSLNLEKDFSCAFKIVEGVSSSQKPTCAFGISEKKDKNQNKFTVQDNGSILDSAHPDIEFIDNNTATLQQTKINNGKLAMTGNPLNFDKQDKIKFVFTIQKASNASDILIGLSGVEKALKNGFTFKNSDHQGYFISQNGQQYSPDQNKNETPAYCSKTPDQPKTKVKFEEQKIDDIKTNQSLDQQEIQVQQQQNNKNNKETDNNNAKQQLFKFYQGQKIECCVSLQEKTITYTNLNNNSVFKQDFQTQSQQKYYITIALTNKKDTVHVIEKPFMGNNTFMVTDNRCSIQNENNCQIEKKNVSFDLKKGDVICLQYSSETQMITFKKHKTDNQFSILIPNHQTLSYNLTCMMNTKNTNLQFIENTDNIHYYLGELYSEQQQESLKNSKLKQDDMLKSQATVDTNSKRREQFMQEQERKRKIEQRFRAQNSNNSFASLSNSCIRLNTKNSFNPSQSSLDSPSQFVFHSQIRSPQKSQWGQFNSSDSVNGQDSTRKFSELSNQQDEILIKNEQNKIKRIINKSQDFSKNRQIYSNSPKTAQTAKHKNGGKYNNQTKLTPLSNFSSYSKHHIETVQLYEQNKSKTTHTSQLQSPRQTYVKKPQQFK